MDKTKAAAIVNSKGFVKLDANNNGNVSWANINSSKNVWWIDIPIKKFHHDSHLLLNDKVNKIFHWIYIPRGTFPDPYNTFRQLRDGYISVELSSKDTNKFIDVKSGGTKFDFKKLKITSEGYSDKSDKGLDRIVPDKQFTPLTSKEVGMSNLEKSSSFNTESVSSLEESMQDLFNKLAAVQKEIRIELKKYCDNKVLKGNEIVGWLGEIYGKLLFNGDMVDDSNEHDIESADGKRISVKTRKGWQSGWSQSSAIPKIEGDECPTHLLFVHLDDDYSIHGMWLFEWDYLYNNGRFKKHIVRGNHRSYIFHLNENNDSANKIYSKAI